MPSKTITGFHLQVGPANVYVRYSNAEAALVVMSMFEDGKLSWYETVRRLDPGKLETPKPKLVTERPLF